MNAEPARSEFVDVERMYTEGDTPAARINRLRRDVALHKQSTGLSDAEIARRSDLSASTYSEFMRGTYKGNASAVGDKLEKWLKAEADNLETSISREITRALVFAQAKPSLVLITVGSGLGKTKTLKQYSSERLHAFRVPIEPIEGKPAAALRTIARVLGVVEPKTNIELTARLKERLRRDHGRQPLLMIDEAQNLTDAAVNQLRFLLDEAGCGLALAGNEDLMTRYSMGATREGFGQIHRRIGLRIHVKNARPSDVDQILDAMGVDDREVRRIAHMIATRAGGYGQVVDTLQLASITAYGERTALNADHVRRAWGNRSREDLGR